MVWRPRRPLSSCICRAPDRSLPALIIGVRSISPQRGRTHPSTRAFTRTSSATGATVFNYVSRAMQWGNAGSGLEEVAPIAAVIASARPLTPSLVIDMAQMGRHGAVADEKHRPNLWVRLASDHEAKNLVFPCGQSATVAACRHAESVVLTAAAAETCGHL